jgi:N-acetylglucosamine-6-sulfatase
VESLQAVDELVRAVVHELDAKRVLDNTYVIFTSDNGWHHGEHRIPQAKATVYEESIHMPLLIRGPGVTPGSKTGKVALNIDVFPTFADLGGAVTSRYVDGRSLRPVLEGTPTAWRTAFLIERGGPHSFFGIQSTEQKKYVEYEEDARELYDLSADPYELENSYNVTPREDLTFLTSRLEALKSCAGETCRAAEDGP